MSRDGSGNYSLPLPPVVTGTTIEATWANNTLDDIKAALTDSLSRSGSGNMSVPFKAVDGSVSAPSLSFSSEANSGLYRLGAADIRMSVEGSDLMSWSTASGTTITSNVSVTGNTAVTGDFTVTGDVVMGTNDAFQLDLIAGRSYVKLNDLLLLNPSVLNAVFTQQDGILRISDSDSSSSIGNEVVLEGSNHVVRNSSINQEVEIRGGVTNNTNGRAFFYGASHATKPSWVEIFSQETKIYGNYVYIDGGTLGVEIAAGDLFTLKVEGQDRITWNTFYNHFNFNQTGIDNINDISGSNWSGSRTGSLSLQGGNATDPDAQIKLFGGAHPTNPSETQINGSIVMMPNLPTSDPVNAGQLWNDSGTLKISAG